MVDAAQGRLVRARLYFHGAPPPEDGEDLYGYCRLTYKKNSKYKPTAAETAEANRKEDAKAAAKEAERKAKED